jgi:hypothetical protein
MVIVLFPLPAMYSDNAVRAAACPLLAKLLPKPLAKLLAMPAPDA